MKTWSKRFYNRGVSVIEIYFDCEKENHLEISSFISGIDYATPKSLTGSRFIKRLLEVCARTQNTYPRIYNANVRIE